MWLGMNDEQVKAQGGVLRQQSDAVSTLMGKIDAEVAQLKSIWAGEDQAKFEQEWNGTHKAELEKVKQMLIEMANTIDRQVSEQQSTSQNY